jgi:hypothetical protein
MKAHPRLMTASSLVVLATLAALLPGCGGKTQTGPIPTLDLEAAIDNQRTFDLAEIAGAIEFIPLDDTQPNALVGNIRDIAATKERFYVQDDGREFLFKIFDRRGRFLSTLGRYGRGPEEFMGNTLFTTDHDGGILYVSGTTGDMRNSGMTFDATGSLVNRNDSVSGGKIAFFDGRLFVIKSSPAPFNLRGDPDFKPSLGTPVPLLEIYSADLKRERVVETIDKGSGGALIVDGNLSDPSSIRSITVLKGPAGILSTDGTSLSVKEERGDTVYHYRSGALEPAFRLTLGGYETPAESFGLNPTVGPGDSYSVQNIFESDGHVIVAATGQKDKVNVVLVIDRDDPAGGISATGGPEGVNGLFLDGLRFTPMYVRDNRLVGYMQALDIVDNADAITNPDLAALAATLKEDGNPVLVIATLKR